ncbi:hypothetical protein SERLA73DRAFT_149643 [Serpula lacrymans var. lacrymans S7.3]|uniref:Uncharacterized protein n=1 Tax=Serpula lacrymans var. lacrymans (strain S7.3) TaxID=936435 RepID=F8PK23_SERL3|nr:hypothetical protein SERLA73DRAFT_149643 [Serpula lacrymans var. lacrymans S7.3]
MLRLACIGIYTYSVQISRLRLRTFLAQGLYSYLKSINGLQLHIVAPQQQFTEGVIGLCLIFLMQGLKKEIGEAVFNCLQSASFSVQPENQESNQLQAGMGHQSAPLSLLEVSQLQYQQQQPSVVNSFGASRSRMTNKNVPDIWILQTEDKKRNLVDPNKQNILDLQSITIILHLVESAAAGEVLPETLPQNIVLRDNASGSHTGADRVILLSTKDILQPMTSLYQAIPAQVDASVDGGVSNLLAAILKEHSRHEKGKAAEDNTLPLPTVWSQFVCNGTAVVVIGSILEVE